MLLLILSEHEVELSKACGAEMVVQIIRQTGVEENYRRGQGLHEL